MLSLCVRLKSEQGSVVAKFQTCEPERPENTCVSEAVREFNLKIWK